MQGEKTVQQQTVFIHTLSAAQRGGGAKGRAHSFHVPRHRRCGCFRVFDGDAMSAHAPRPGLDVLEQLSMPYTDTP